MMQYTVSSHRGQTGINVCGVLCYNLWYFTAPNSFDPGEKVGKNPAPFLIQQILAPIAAEGSVRVSKIKPPDAPSPLHTPFPSSPKCKTQLYTFRRGSPFATFVFWRKYDCKVFFFFQFSNIVCISVLLHKVPVMLELCAKFPSMQWVFPFRHIL